MNNEGQGKAEFITWQTFSIFISSTFRDMQAERDHLKNVVFPKVEAELRKSRVRLEVVDLRWGVETSAIDDESEREARVLQVCLEEIKRCRPFFIGLLGDRYGWVPAEERMKDAIRKEANLVHKKDKSVTALEIEFGVLASEQQLTRSVFYFRKPRPYNNMPGDLAARYSDEYDPELTVKEKLIRKIALADLKEQIVTHFDNKRLKDKVKPYPVTWDSKMNKVVELETWGDIVYEDIIRECKAQAKITEEKAAKNVYEQEEALLDAFIEDHTHITTIKTDNGVEKVPTFCGRDELLKELKEHLLNADADKWGLVLTGESGSGKSAVFSKIYRMLQREDCVLLANSAGISPRSRNVADLLQRWNRQLSKRLCKECEAEINPTDEFDLKGISSQQKEKKPAIEELQQKFKELLFTVAKKEQVVILIDALDRFESTSRGIYMTWLPLVMPCKVRMLCTAITGTDVKAVQYHRELVSRDIDHFTQEEAEVMLEMLCRKQHKDMPVEVKNTILNKRRFGDILACSSPLWLSLAVNILMAMDNEDFIRIQKREGRADLGINDHMLQMVTEFPAVPGDLFLSLVKKAAGYFGDEFTEKVFNYLACSRNGLRESDLEKIILAKNEKWDALSFANIRRWFAAHIREEGENLQWNLAHSILRKTLIDEIGEYNKKNIHNSIADHLQTLPAEDSLRIFETMYHLMTAENTLDALGYYISRLSLPEEIGATKAITEAITTNKNGIDWVFLLLSALVYSPSIYLSWRLSQRLASLFIYDLNDALKKRGNLENRKKMLEKLKTNLIKTRIDYKINADYGYDIATLYQKLGEIYQSEGNFDRALQHYEEDNKLMKELYVSNPQNEKLKFGLANSYHYLGNNYESQRHFFPASQCYNECNKLLIELYASNPQNEKIKHNLAISYHNLGILDLSYGTPDQVLPYYKKGIKLSKELYASNPQNEDIKHSLAISYSKLGGIYQSQGNLDQALLYYNEYMKLSKELYASNPQNEKIKQGLAISYQDLGIIYQSRGNFEQALQYYKEYNKLNKELYASNPQNFNLLEDLGISYYKLANIYKAMGNDKKGKEIFAECKKIISFLLDNFPKVFKYQKWNQVKY